MEQASVSLIAVSSAILCPTETYTGLEASSDVRTACIKNIYACEEDIQ